MKNSPGYNLYEILHIQCENNYKEFQKKLILPDDKKASIQSQLMELSTPSFTTAQKGKKLEELTRLVFEALGFFRSYANIHTSTNEIDFLCKLSPAGKNAKSDGFIDFEDDFLVECKNYSTKVGVTYVGKFASLLESHNKKFGIMVSQKGITGNRWTDSLGLTKKLYLKNGVLIISFDLQDFERLEFESFFSIVESKKDEIINDADISQYITKHPGE